MNVADAFFLLALFLAAAFWFAYLIAKWRDEAKRGPGGW